MASAFISSLSLISIPANRSSLDLHRLHQKSAGRSRRRPCSSMTTAPASLTNFTVTKKNGVCLSCVLDPVPSGDNNNERCPLYVLVHGYRDSKNGRFITKLVAELSSRGVQTARFDTTGNGESTGEFTYANYFGEAEDLRAVIEHLRMSMRLEVDAIVGHSKGAGVVLIYAQKYGDIPLIVPLAPRYRMTTGIVERFGAQLLKECRETGAVEITDRDGFKFTLTKAALEERESMDMGVIAKGISAKNKLVLVHGDADTTIPVGDADLFDHDIQHLEKIIIQGADHGFRGKEAQVVDAFCAR